MRASLRSQRDKNSGCDYAFALSDDAAPQRQAGAQSAHSFIDARSHRRRIGAPAAVAASAGDDAPAHRREPRQQLVPHTERSGQFARAGLKQFDLAEAGDDAVFTPAAAQPGRWGLRGHANYRFCLRLARGVGFVIASVQRPTMSLVALFTAVVD